MTHRQAWSRCFLTQGQRGWKTLANHKCQISILFSLTFAVTVGSVTGSDFHQPGVFKFQRMNTYEE